MTAPSVNQNLIVKTYEHNGVSAQQEGEILSAPYPTSYPYTGDFKTDLARILVAEGYVLPDDWMASAQLDEPQPEEEGVVN